MNRLLLLFGFAILSHIANSQTTATLEEFDLDPETYLNDSGEEGGFSSGNVFLPNSFEDFDTYTVWAGWAISNITDSETPGFENQYSAITGGGVDESLTYAVGYPSDSSMLYLVGDAAGGLMQGMYLTNSTYAYLSMQDGDSFAKKFGGETGDDPDYFMLTIKAYYDGSLSEDSIDFYLADFRFEDNSEDYIVDTWTYVDLTSLGFADSLKFTLTSTDVGDFGMNTPGYFCADNIITANGLVSTNRPQLGPPLRVFPNPASEYLRLTWPETEDAFLTIADMQGRALSQTRIQPGQNDIALQGMSTGTYVATLRYENQVRSSLVVIR